MGVGWGDEINSNNGDDVFTGRIFGSPLSQFSSNCLLNLRHTLHKQEYCEFKGRTILISLLLNGTPHFNLLRFVASAHCSAPVVFL